MDIDIKLALLEKIYAIYEKFVDDHDFFCKKQCAHCCTRNVTMTTLEGYYLLSSLDPVVRAKLMETIQQQDGINRFFPQVTINQLADLCAKGIAFPEEENEVQWGQCPVLDHDICPIYLKRPFGCRCMVSLQNCGSSGYADMPSWVISVNNVVMQYIEHIDGKGSSGNFTDVMIYLNDPENYGAYTKERHIDSPKPLLTNQSISVLMAPPEDRTRIEPLLQAIRGIKIDRESAWN